MHLMIMAREAQLKPILHSEREQVVVRLEMLVPRRHNTLLQQVSSDSWLAPALLKRILWIELHHTFRGPPRGRRKTMRAGAPAWRATPASMEIIVHRAAPKRTRSSWSVAISADVVFSDLPVVFIGRRPVAVPYRTAEDLPGEDAPRRVGFIRPSARE